MATVDCRSPVATGTLELTCRLPVPPPYQGRDKDGGRNYKPGSQAGLKQLIRGIRGKAQRQGEQQLAVVHRCNGQPDGGKERKCTKHLQSESGADQEDDD